MPAASRPSLTPRKQPRQARSLATVDTIFEATIQVLVSDGPRRLTTTRVAHRAGVSVGTMYQYFPHKQALFYALNERYLMRLAERIEVTCLEQHGAVLADMVKALVTVYWTAKTERPKVTRALYQSVTELDNEPLIAAFARRVDVATENMLLTAADGSFTDLPSVTLTLLSTVFGTVRNIFERDLPAEKGDVVCQQLNVMCIAYLSAVRSPDLRTRS